MNDRKLNDFTPPPPQPGNRVGWKALKMTVDYPDEMLRQPNDENKENGQEKAPKS